MRLATILPRGSLVAVPVAAAPDGTWIEIAALIGREAWRVENVLPWLMKHGEALVKRAATWAGPRYRESEFAFCAPILRPPAFRDFQALEHEGAAWREAPAFCFSNHNGLVGHEAAICAPAGCEQLDYELELGVVIGWHGRDIAPERAWEHVFGFTVVNDFSARDVQDRELALGLGLAKAKDFATAVGPWLVPRRHFTSRIHGEMLELAMCARMNGRELSRGNMTSLPHSIPQLIAHASRDADLFPGDLLGIGAVGTGGLFELGADGRDRWLEPGDIVELEIEQIGVLRTRITERAGNQNVNVEVTNHSRGVWNR